MPSNVLLSVVAAAVLLAVFSGCRSPQRRLVGKWHSNQSLTLPTWPMRPGLAADERARFDDLFGKLSVTYTATDFLCELPAKEGGQPFSQRVAYRVAASNASSITIAYKELSTGQPTTRTIHFDGPDLYWVDLRTNGKLKGGKEYFDRVKP